MESTEEPEPMCLDDMQVPFDPSIYHEELQRFLAEDLGTGDITTTLLVSRGRRARGTLLAKGQMVLAGVDLFAEVFRLLDASVDVERNRADGEELWQGDIVESITGLACPLLTGERVALNLLQRLSGIATVTRQYVRAVAGTGVCIVDTRKTTPGLRDLEKYAVRVGGGRNHRRDLGEAVLIKDNHIRMTGSVRPALEAAEPAAGKAAWIEVEVTDLKELQEAVSLKPDMVLLDNMTPAEVRQAVSVLRAADPERKIRTEASGRITLTNVRRYAEAGVDWISIGALTHSAPAVDLSFEVEPL
jgi:nicotinate-nucleotide pyrophosphorylase (carboxylating)